jgi:hypothetical protein
MNPCIKNITFFLLFSTHLLIRKNNYHLLSQETVRTILEKSFMPEKIKEKKIINEAMSNENK